MGFMRVIPKNSEFKYYAMDKKGNLLGKGDNLKELHEKFPDAILGGDYFPKGGK